MHLLGGECHQCAMTMENLGKAIFLMVKVRHMDLSSILSSVTLLRVERVPCSNLVLSLGITHLSSSSD